MFFGQLISCFGPEVRFDIFFVENVWFVSAVKFEKRVPHAGNFRVIISKFHYK